ncbi:MAG: hypothetical protein ACYCOU_14855 [Sulfobacillus sp.]
MKNPRCRWVSVSAGILTLCLTTGARADNGILSLDCSNGNSNVKHIWINLGTDAVTDDYGTKSGVPVSPATITPTTIKYYSTWLDGITWTEFIDRTTGKLSEWQTVHGMTYNQHTATCVKSDLALPATKF